MSSLTITIPDELDARVVSAYAAHYAYQATVSNPAHDPGGSTPEEPATIDNPQGKAAFLKAGVVKHIRDAVRAQEQSVASLAARDAVEDVVGIE